MLFTTPIFLFLFLPICLLFYASVGKNKKRLSIFIFSVVFHLLFNLNHPLNLIYLAGLYTYTFFAGKLLESKPSKKTTNPYLTAFLAALPFVYLIFLRNIDAFEYNSFIYPLGITFQVFSAVSYIIESAGRKTPERDNPLDLLFYLTFFPVQFAGPIIKYPKFRTLLKEENIAFSMKNTALGARIFMTGFIKRVAVGSVLFDAFRKISDLEKDSPNLVVSVILMLILFFAVYFMFSGYSDMGVGIARIFGIKLNIDSNPPFGAPMPVAYFSCFFKSLHEFIIEYFFVPLKSITKGKRLFLTEAAIYTLTVYLFIQTKLYVLLVAIPTIILMFITEKAKIQSRLADKKGIQTIFTTVNAFVITISLVPILINNNEKIFGYIRGITVFGSEYKFDQILIATSIIQLLTIIFMAFFTCIPKYKTDKFLLKRLSLKTGAGFDYFILFILLILFAFTIMFFLPQYPEYDFNPFYYINL